MTKIIITAQKCKFERFESGFQSMSYMMLQRPLVQEERIIKTAEDARAAALDVKARVEAMVDHSFFVSVAIARGERAPRGFRNLPSRWECDRDTVAAPEMVEA